MGEFDPKAWQGATKRFIAALGNQRVNPTMKGIVLHFDLSNIEEFNQFQLLGKLATERKGFHYKTTGEETGTAKIQEVSALENPVISIIISPKSNMDDVFSIAGLMVATRKTPEGEIRRPIVVGENAALLEQKTGVQWVEVQNAPYGDNQGENHIIEAVLPEAPDKEMRARQERALGYLMLPRHQVRGKVHEWVGLQETVEQKRGLERRTAVPKSWVANLNKRIEANDAPEGVQKKLPDLFNKR